MKKKNEQIRRREVAPCMKPVKTAECRIIRRDRASAEEPYSCRPAWGGLFGGRPPMWHPAPSLF